MTSLNTWGKPSQKIYLKISLGNFKVSRVLEVQGETILRDRVLEADAVSTLYRLQMIVACGFLIVVSAFAAEERSVELNIWKCCRKGETFDTNAVGCITRRVTNDMFRETERLSPPMDSEEVYWIPKVLRTKQLHVHYNKKLFGGVAVPVDEQELMVGRFLLINNTARAFFLSLFSDYLPPQAVLKQFYCFEATPNPEYPLVIRSLVSLRLLNKCCPKGHQLNSQLNNCVPRLSYPVPRVDQEIFNPESDPQNTYWMPNSFTNHIVVAQYMKYDFRQANVVADLDDESQYKLIEREEVDGYKVFVNVPTKWGAATGTVAWSFCLDAVAPPEEDFQTASTEMPEVEDASDESVTSETKVVEVGGNGSEAEATNMDMIIKTTDATGETNSSEDEENMKMTRSLKLGETMDLKMKRVIRLADMVEKVKTTEVTEEMETTDKKEMTEGSRLKETTEMSETANIAVETITETKTILKSTPVIYTESPEKGKIADNSKIEIEKLKQATDSAQLREAKAISLHEESRLGRKRYPARVLLAAVTKVNKCCGRGEGIAWPEGRCAPRPGRSVTDVAIGEEDPQSADWLPPQLRHQRIMPVLYNAIRNIDIGAVRRPDVSDVHNWTIHVPLNDTPALLLSFKTPTGAIVHKRAETYCFDYISGGPKAPNVIYGPLRCGFDDLFCILKCCKHNMLLNEHGECVSRDGEGWHPLKSLITPYLRPDRAYADANTEIPFCPKKIDVSFIDSEDSAKNAAEILSQNCPIRSIKHVKTVYCADLLLLRDGSLREAMASCSWPPSGGLYARVRPLLGVAVALLAVAAATMAAQGVHRRSAHDWAMGAHAAALLAAAALQLAVFLQGDNDVGRCEKYAYAVYYFLVAAGFWLNVVSINMAIGFRRPAGARGAGGGGGGGGGGGSGRRRFLFLCAYAVGGSAALTGTCVYMHANRNKMRARGIASPSLFETKTCFVESMYCEQCQYFQYDALLEVGSLYYYYIPMAVLVLVNVICVALTMMKIRELRSDSQILRKTKGSGQDTVSCLDSPPLQSALLYAKLLVTAGLVEFALEAAAWGARRRRHESGRGAEEFSEEVALIYRICSTLLDVARAAAVCWLGAPWRAWAAAARRWGRRWRRAATPEARAGRSS